MTGSYLLRHPPGTPPGTLVTPENALPSQVRLFAYDTDEYIERQIDDLNQIPQLLARWKVVWIDVDGLGSKETIERLGTIFNLHPLALEDVLSLRQRPKLEEYGEARFFVARMAHLTGGKLVTEQLSLFFGKNFVLTFQDKPGDCLDPVRERIRKGAGGRLRGSGTEYLVYALVDAVVDGYFPVLEHYSGWIDRLEDEVTFKADRQTIERIHHVKRKLNRLRHEIWPMREAINGFAHLSTMNDQTRLYVRDCYDHLIQVFDLMETDRERASSLVEVYLSSVSNRMNEVMKLLTVMTAIFIPLTFISSIYGMNFEDMPELHWRYGYPAVLCFMAAIAAAMVYYFNRRGWFKDGG